MSWLFVYDTHSDSGAVTGWHWDHDEQRSLVFHTFMQCESDAHGHGMPVTEDFGVRVYTELRRPISD